VRGEDGTYYGWLWSFRDVTEQRRAEDRLRLLAAASEVLTSSVDYYDVLRRIARLALPTFAESCNVYLLEGEQLVRVGVAHVDPEREQLLASMPDRFPVDAALPAAEAFRAGEPIVLPTMEDATIERVAAGLGVDAAAIRELGTASLVLVPLVAREEPVGLVTFASTIEERYDDRDVAFARELARRIAVRVENARLYHAVEERAQAARVLDAVGDGVFLIDATGVVRLWNPAAEQVTGLRSDDVVGRPAEAAIPGWGRASRLVPVADWPQAAAMHAETVPLDVGSRELWLSISGVGFADGTVYAFRDLTEERTVEQLKSDFVSTVSHELRTPLAAIYGAALTLGRSELELEQDQQRRLLDVIAGEADRLARTVNDILWASRLDSGQLHVTIESHDPAALAGSVVEAQRTHLPASIELRFEPPAGLPRVRADEDKLRQVLTNLLDNAIKYSPDGGVVEVGLERSDASRVRFWVRDEGLGIPAGEQERIFEKFYRLDPQLTRGVGGTGLGLYICRELVRRMEGRLWVYSLRGEGSTFFVELPVV
jgi:signal transduction histidine kinase